MKPQKIWVLNISMAIEANETTMHWEKPRRMMMPKKITNRLHSTRTLKVDLHNKIIEDLTESTGVMPAKYPPKVKLELFS